MTYYIYYFLIIVFSFVVDFSKDRHVKKIFLYFLIVFLVFFCGLRSSYVGTDTLNYMGFIDEADSYSFYQLEPLFNLLLKSSIIFDSNYKYLYVFLITALITFVSFFKGIRYHSIPIGIFFSLAFAQTGFFYDQFNTIRQLCATGIVFYALRYIFDDKLKYIFFILIASMFHYSALICFVFIFFEFYKKYWKSCVFFASVFFYSFYSLFFQKIIAINNKYSVYYDIDINTEFIGKGALLFNLFFLFVNLFWLKYIREIYKEKYLFFLIIFFVGFVIQLIIGELGYGGLAAIKLTYYFLYAQIFLMSYIYFSLYKDARFFFWIFIVTLMSFKFLYMLSNSTLLHMSYSILDYLKW